MISLADIAKELSQTMQCNCNLDKWEPNRDTWHSFVCRIDKAARAKALKARPEGEKG